MKTLITTGIHPASYQLAFLLKEHAVVFGSDLNGFPQADSNSLAHQLLKVCLDEQIERIFPLRYPELAALSESKVLFAEFGIEIMVSEDSLYSLCATPKKATNFIEFSTHLIGLGYPTTKVVIGNSTNRGQFILVDDEVRSNNQVWGQVSSMSFSQLGKWFNNINFEDISVYKIDGQLQRNYLLIENQQVKSLRSLNGFLIDDLVEKLLKSGSRGFFYIVSDDTSILSVTQASV